MRKDVALPDFESLIFSKYQGLKYPAANPDTRDHKCYALLGIVHLNEEVKLGIT